MRVLVSCIALVLAVAAPESPAHNLHWRPPPVAKTYRADPIRGTVLDSATARGLSGAVVVARWEWLENEYDGFRVTEQIYHGEALHVAEAVSDETGSFHLPGWGPVERAYGVIRENAPRLCVFKPAYEPVCADPGKDGRVTIRRFTGTPREYAERIVRFQEEIGWNDPRQAPPVPRLALAIHREKVRLAAEGAVIYGVYRMKGRSGELRVVDAATKQPIGWAVARVAWKYVRDDAAESRDVVQVKGVSSQFLVSRWRLNVPSVPGWHLDLDSAPRVRLYAAGYRHSSDLEWPDSGGDVALEKTPDEAVAVLAEVRALRAEIDARLQAGNRGEALAQSEPLLFLLSRECGTLRFDLRKDLCFPPDSDAEKMLRTGVRSPRHDTEPEEGLSRRPVSVGGSSTPARAPSVNGPPLKPGQEKPVGGFEIGPARK